MGNEHAKKPATWQELFQAVKEVPLLIGLEDFGAVDYADGEARICCPCHEDSRPGDVFLEPLQTSWKCAVCRKKGRLVDYVSRFRKISVPDAALEIAVRERILTEEERRAWDVPRVPRPRPVRPPAPVRADPERCHRVYECFVEESPPLTAEHAAFLRERDIRGWEEDFFEWPREEGGFGRRFAERVRARLGMSLPQALSGVPGFAWDTTWDRFDFLRCAGGIGILLRDERGRIAGMQIRQDSGTRYLQFSSGWAVRLEPDAVHPQVRGASCGPVPDINRPPAGTPLRGTAITEGKFKAVALARRGWLTLSLIGVNNTKGVLDRFLAMPEAAADRRVTVFFDVDLFANRYVADAALDLHAGLRQRGKEVFLAVWPPELGKGIDDVLRAGRGSQVEIRPMEDFRDRLEQAKAARPRKAPDSGPAAFPQAEENNRKT